MDRVIADKGSPYFVESLPTFDSNELFMVFENNRIAPDVQASWMFYEPEELVICTAPKNIDDAFDRIQAGINRGLYAAGWLAYELGYLLEPKLRTSLPREEGQPPFVIFGLFRKRRLMSQIDLASFWAGQTKTVSPGFQIRNLLLNMNRATYIDTLHSIKDYIIEGDTYQVNYTLKYFFEATGNLFELYKVLRHRQQTEFSVFLNVPDRTILSLSPELFFRKENSTMICRPMKGTWHRGNSLADDAKQADWLRNDEKNLAENVMIVDLIRNDLGRLAHTGSVLVSKLFHIEQYETLLQMTSTIMADIDSDTSFRDIIYRLFPCGSVTGTPKIRTMEIIRELELKPRGIYTGSIGFITPNNYCCFNIAIRTLIIDDQGNGEMGIGGGIIFDSDPATEWEECILKGQFMTTLAEAKSTVPTF